jgi:hypothetical protein
MVALDPPSLPRYLVGCVLMLAGVVGPLGYAWARVSRRGHLNTSRALGCV